jgi:hypothetical protein
VHGLVLLLRSAGELESYPDCHRVSSPRGFGRAYPRHRGRAPRPNAEPAARSQVVHCASLASGLAGARNAGNAGARDSGLHVVNG